MVVIASDEEGEVFVVSKDSTEKKIIMTETENDTLKKSFKKIVVTKK